MAKVNIVLNYSRSQNTYESWLLIQVRQKNEKFIFLIKTFINVFGFFEIFKYENFIFWSAGNSIVGLPKLVSVYWDWLSASHAIHLVLA